MNGAMAELCARINSRAKTPSVIRMGVIHQRLLLQKNANNSPAMPKRCPVVFKKPIFPPQPHSTARFSPWQWRRFSIPSGILDPLEPLPVPKTGNPSEKPFRWSNVGAAILPHRMAFGQLQNDSRERRSEGRELHEVCYNTHAASSRALSSAG